MANRKSPRAYWVSVSLIAALAQPLAITAIAGLGAMAIAPAAQAATLTAWQFDSASRQLEITVPQGTTPRYFLLAQPARIVVDLPETQVGAVSAQQTYSGPVRQIRVSQFEPNTARIVIELSPDAELADGQVELRPASGSQTNRWVLRPLIAGDSSAVAAQPAAPAAPDSIAAPAASPAPVAPAAPLPPLEPGGVELAVDPPTSALPSVAAAPVAPPADAAAPVAPVEAAEPPVEAAPSPAPITAEEPTAPAAVDDALPPPSFDKAPQVSVAVPPVGQAIAPPQDAATLDSAQRQADGLRESPAPPPPVMAPTSPAPSVTAPPLAASPAPAVPPPSVTAVEFGQPLPVAVAPPSNRPTVAAAPDPTVLLPSGTVLNARYPGGSALQLSADEPWQEVLVLAQPVVDVSGSVLFPSGSQVIGRFETGQQGSRFVAQAVSVNGQSIPIQAESEPISGDRELSRDNILLNSAIGAAALGVLSGFSGIGLLGGLAAGAATGYFTSPKPAVIEPNQIVQIRLTEDLARF